MKKLTVLLLVVISTGLVSCLSKEKREKSPDAPLIVKPNPELKNDLMTPEVLWSFGRVSEPELSPDQKSLVYGVTYYDIAQNKGNRELFTMSVNGGEASQITSTKFSEYQAMWTPDGKKIAFLSSETGSMQLWEMDTDGKNRKQITDIENGIDGYKYSPDGKHILFISEVAAEKPLKDLYAGLPKASGKIFTDHMYRHWDTWVESFSHVFYAEMGQGLIKSGKDILEGEPYECPLKPFGGMEQINWSPDGKVIAYTCRKKTGLAYTLSTNSDIFLFDLETGKTTNISEGMLGYDVAPSYSPDGKMIAWQSMEREGYEADKNRLFLMDLTTQTKTDLSREFDQHIDFFSWSENGQSIYFISDYHGCDEIYRVDLKDGQITKVTEGVHNYKNVAQAGDKLIASRVSMSMPEEIYAVDPISGKDAQLTFTNKELLDKLSFGKVEARWIKTTDQKDMHTWVIYPPHFDPSKKYPTLLYCEGGPQSTVSQFWSYRWNFQMMAANNYIIVAPNRRGLPGFGQAWNEQISGDYGGQNMKDYLSAIDAMTKEPYVNKDRLGCVGASYGGFSVFWLAGNHQKRFKAFIAHDGMFNLESQYLETDEMWFVNWDLGGPFWDKSNKIAQRSYASSPHRFVQNWDTPILVVHGELDYRIAATQGMQAFNAAILKGVPAELLYFPDENHWVLKPQNGILWQRTFFNWLDRWLK